jgi:hypothetical protein
MCGREPFGTFVFFMSSTVQVSGSQLLDGLALQASDAISSLYFGKFFESQRCKRIGTEGVHRKPAGIASPESAAIKV